MSDQPTCKGDWALGTACGQCQRCIDAAPAEARRLQRQLKSTQADFDMYVRAWERELMGFIVHKRHHIDCLVLSTQRLREEVFRLREAERVRKLNAALASRDECDAAWRSAAREWSEMPS